MSDNVFEMLAGKERKSNKADKGEPSKESPIVQSENGSKSLSNSVVPEGEESTWTVQSTKARRLVPQFSLSRQDLGSDSSRSKPVISEPVKKKVIRFTKDEMLALRKPSKILSIMSDMLEVVSLTPLDPVCFDKLEPDDVVRIWNSENGRNNKDNAGGRGRGRGPNTNFSNNTANANATVGNRAKGPDDLGQQAAPSASTGEWTQRHSNRGGGLWDDGKSGSSAGALDLADFAAAALKFRTEMAEMKFSDEGEGAGEDMMERLMREQTEGELLGDDDEDAMPDWAADGDSSGAGGLDIFAKPAAQQPLAKRSLLLETLNVSTPVSAVASAQPISSSKSALLSSVIGSKPQQQALGADTSSIDHLLMASFSAPLPVAAAAEWFYTDPQNQVQGPFSQDNMQLWHEAGYFSKDLPIKLRHWGGFHPFVTVFPDLKQAFLSAPSEPRANFPSMPPLMSNVSAEQHHHVEQKQLLARAEAQAAEAQRQAVAAEEQRRAAAEAKRQAEAAQQRHSGPPPLVPVSVENKATQPSSKSTAVPLDALRKIRISNIGELNRTSEAQTVPAKEPRAESKHKSGSSGPPPLVSEKQKDGAAPWAGSSTGNHSSKTASASKESLVSIQKAEKERAAHEKVLRDQELKQQQKASKNWSSSNGAGAAKNLSASLADIQEEETRRQEKQRALAASQQPPAVPLTMSSQLKSLLGVKPTGQPTSTPTATKQWSSAAPAPAADSANAPSLRDIMQQEEKHTAPSADRASNSRSRQQPLSWAAKAGTGVNASNLLPVPAAQQSRPAAKVEQQVETKPVSAPTAPKVSKAAAGKKDSGSEFGGKGMSYDMAEWCSARLKKINGSEDLTLLEFCMSLESAGEIREYLAQYLGSSPQLTNFATDFINYKEGNAGAKKKKAPVAGK